MVGVRGDFSGVGICCCQSRQVSLDVLPGFRCSIWRVFVGFEVGVGFGGDFVTVESVVTESSTGPRKRFLGVKL